MPQYQIIKDKKSWNLAIAKEKNFSAYQIYEWGEYKSNMGWEIASIKANKNGKLAYLQITYKQKFNVFVGWCVGSISGSVDCFEKEKFIAFIKETFGVKYIFIKTSFTNSLDFNDSLDLYSSGWKKSCQKMNSDYTIYINLEKSVEEFMSGCSANFRKNLKRGYEKNRDIKVSFLDEASADELNAIFRKFEGLKEVALPRLNEIMQIQNYLGQRIIIAKSTIDENVVAIRAFLYFENIAIDFWAASVDKGRESYSSHVLLFELLKKAKELGCSKYDMSGIDPLLNPNVFSFKNGLRGDIVEKLGEWEISNSTMLSCLINRFYL